MKLKTYYTYALDCDEVGMDQGDATSAEMSGPMETDNIQYPTNPGRKVPCASDEMKSRLDISHYAGKDHIPDDVKYNLINNRLPPKGFKFPAKQYKDKRKPGGMINRHCKDEWFTQFDFISYSVAQDSIYCNTCLLFLIDGPKGNKQKPNILVTKPYNNWKDATGDLKVHSVSEAHTLATARKSAFIDTYLKPDERIDNVMNKHVKDTVQRNRQFLTSIIKCIELCGRNGIALRGHRDDATSFDKSHQGNFKNLLDFRIDAGDTYLKEHLETCAKNASYISKTTQNDLLECIKEYVQDVIVNEISSQEIGSKYSRDTVPIAT